MTKFSEALVPVYTNGVFTISRLADSKAHFLIMYGSGSVAKPSCYQITTDEMNRLMTEFYEYSKYYGVMHDFIDLDELDSIYHGNRLQSLIDLNKEKTFEEILDEADERGYNPYRR